MILLFPFSAREQKVVYTVMRKTYGYGKKEDDMSASQIGDMCGLARTHVTAVLNDLAARRIITKRPGQYGSIIGINKRHSEWSRPAKNELQNPAVPTPVPASTESVQGRTKSVLPDCTKNEQTASTDLVQGSTDLVQECTETVLVPNWFPTSTESVQVDSTESVHTKDNLPKDNQQKILSGKPDSTQLGFAGIEKSGCLEDGKDARSTRGKSTAKQVLKQAAAEVLSYLNDKSGHRFKPVDGTLNPIIARLGDGFAADDCKAVIDAKVKQWASDPKMAEYLRPSTLFRASNFPQYAGQLSTPPVVATRPVDSRFAGAK